MLKALAVLLLAATPALAQHQTVPFEEAHIKPLGKTLEKADAKPVAKPFDPFVTCLHQETDDDYYACADYFYDEIVRSGLWCEYSTARSLAYDAAKFANNADPNKMILYPGAEFAMLPYGPAATNLCHFPIQLDN